MTLPQRLNWINSHCTPAEPQLPYGSVYPLYEAERKPIANNWRKHVKDHAKLQNEDNDWINFCINNALRYK